VKNVSVHAGYRMKQRKISIDDLVKDLKEPSATYPGNKKIRMQPVSKEGMTE